jgi:hypothetical protein
MMDSKKHGDVHEILPKFKYIQLSVSYRNDIIQMQHNFDNSPTHTTTMPQRRQQ